MCVCVRTQVVYSLQIFSNISPDCLTFFLPWDDAQRTWCCWLIIIDFNNPSLLSECRWSGGSGHGCFYDMMLLGAIKHDSQRGVKPAFDTHTVGLWKVFGKKKHPCAVWLFHAVLLMSAMIRGYFFFSPSLVLLFFFTLLISFAYCFLPSVIPSKQLNTHTFSKLMFG